MSDYDSQVEKLYRDFVGEKEKELETLKERFRIDRFTQGDWRQVMTSLSTQIMGTGITFSSVSATYTESDDKGTIYVTNRANNGKLEKIFINGKSTKRHELETCRTVKFDKIDIEGDYWIFYINGPADIMLVAAPIIIPTILGPICVTNTFGLYVLTMRTREKFWGDNEESRGQRAEINKQLKKYGFTNFYNCPVFSGESIPITNIDDGTESTGKINF